MTFINSKQIFKKRVLVVGAGLVGMTTALRLAQSGVQVVLVDRAKPATGASWAAAGMLAPAFEAADEPSAHENLFELCLAGADAWRGFAPWLQAYSDTSLDYFGMGAFACAINGSQENRLDVLEAACISRNLPFRRLSGNKARKLDASLSQDVRSVLLLPTDQQIDNWAVIGALMAALAEAGVQVIPDIKITEINRIKSKWEIAALGLFDNVIWTAGVNSGDEISIDGQPAQLLREGVIIPVKGQMLALDPIEGAPKQVLRFGNGYIAPKSTRIIVGATSEWEVADKTVVDSDIEELLKNASQICPVLQDAEIKMTWAGVRPGTSDHAPVIGWSNYDGIAVAAGHYRNGILLAPLTADILTRLIMEEELTPLEKGFELTRFNEGRMTTKTTEIVE